MIKPFYQDDFVTLYNADWRKHVRGAAWLGRKYNVMITDPPYGAKRSGGVGKYGREKWDKANPKWDEATPTKRELETLLALCDDAVIFGGNYFELPPSRNFLVWDKGAGFKDRDFAECEQAWLSWDGNAKIVQRDPLAAGDYRGKFHPTAKPVALMRYCLTLRPEWLKQSDLTVFDPYAGSCATGVACKREGVKSVLFEVNGEYCERAVEALCQQTFW